MKRPFYLLLALIAVASLCIYLLIPGTVKHAGTVSPEVPEAVVTRYLALKKGWAKWWPDSAGTDPADSSRFTYKGIRFTIEANTFTKLSVTLSDGNVSVPSVITLLPGRNLGTEVTWAFACPTGKDPVNRVLGLNRSRKFAEVTGELLDRFRHFVEDEKSVYGFGIQYERVRDSLVMVIRSVSPEYPGTREVYEKVNRLRQFIGEHEIGKNGHPMVNVSRRDDSLYRVMVAMPVTRRVPTPGDMEYSRLVLGNILTAEVRGGRRSIDRAFMQVRRFMQDRRHTSPAIPFEMMITDRLSQPDTGKWITRIYYPIL